MFDTAPKTRAHTLITMYINTYGYIVAKQIAIKTIEKTIAALIEANKNIQLINYWNSVYYYMLIHHHETSDNNITN